MATKKFVVLLMLLAFFSYSAALIADAEGFCKVRVGCGSWWFDPKAKCECGPYEDVWRLDCKGYVTGPSGGKYTLHAFCDMDGDYCSGEVDYCDVS